MSGLDVTTRHDMTRHDGSEIDARRQAGGQTAFNLQHSTFSLQPSTLTFNLHRLTHSFSSTSNAQASEPHPNLQSSPVQSSPVQSSPVQVCPVCPVQSSQSVSQSVIPCICWTFHAQKRSVQVGSGRFRSAQVRSGHVDIHLPLPLPAFGFWSMT